MNHRKYIYTYIYICIYTNAFVRHDTYRYVCVKGMLVCKRNRESWLLSAPSRFVDISRCCAQECMRSIHICDTTYAICCMQHIASTYIDMKHLVSTYVVKLIASTCVDTLDEAHSIHICRHDTHTSQTTHTG